MDVVSAVQSRYSSASKQHEPGLCCPVDYDPSFLRVIPTEVLERDYGCGNPLSSLKSGDVVLDLGSGGGKACFVAAQLVGPTGRVIGVDFNQDMLQLARTAQPVVAERLGFANVGFLRGRIEDLRLDLDFADQCLRETPVVSYDDVVSLQARLERARIERPLVPSGSVDAVISNCVLNLVSIEARIQLFGEIHRVLKRGGQAVISDIVSDVDVPDALRADPELWSGCYSGAMREDRFIQAFADAGLYGVTVLKRDAEPWQVIGGVEFRSVTIAAYKGKEGACWDRLQAVVYRGPFSAVEDDDGHRLERGARIAVCDKTFRLLTSPPYAGSFEAIDSPPWFGDDDVKPFPCDGSLQLRAPALIKHRQLPASEAASNDAVCSCNGTGC